MKGEYVCFKYMEKLVCEFSDDDDTRRKHYHDLKYTSLVIFNMLVKNLRHGLIKDIYRTVLETSKVIEETPLMEEQMRGDIDAYKRELIYWHIEEGKEKMCYRIPNMAKTFTAFRKKRCKVKDYAIEIVTKMYLLDQKDRNAVKQEIAEKRNSKTETEE